MSFHPIFGMLKTLPGKKDITEDIYKEVLSGSYFLQGDVQENLEQRYTKKPFSFSKSS